MPPFHAEFEDICLRVSATSLEGCINTFLLACEALQSFFAINVQQTRPLHAIEIYHSVFFHHHGAERANDTNP